jgi:hypothetical protein
MYTERVRKKSAHLSSHVLHSFTHKNSFMPPQTQVIPENLSKYKKGRNSELQEKKTLFLVTAI